MFFMLSGFLLYRPFAKRLWRAARPRHRRFYRRRFLRIIPAYWCAGRLRRALRADRAGMDDLARNLFVAPAFAYRWRTADRNRLPGRVRAAAGLEHRCRDHLLPDAAAVRPGRGAPGPWSSFRQRYVGLLIGTAVLFVVGNLSRVALVLADPSWTRQALFTLPFFLDLFAVGMAMAVASVDCSRAGRCPGLAWWNEHPRCAGRHGCAVPGRHPTGGAPEPFASAATSTCPPARLRGGLGVLVVARSSATNTGAPPGGAAVQTAGVPGQHLAQLLPVAPRVIEQVKRWTVDGYEQLEALAANPPPATSWRGSPSSRQLRGGGC